MGRTKGLRWEESCVAEHIGKNAKKHNLEGDMSNTHREISNQDISQEGARRQRTGKAGMHLEADLAPTVGHKMHQGLAEMEIAWEACVHIDEGMQHLKIGMAGWGMDDQQMGDWCAWFEGHLQKAVSASPCKLGQRYTAKEVDFSENKLTSFGMSRLLKMLRESKVVVLILKLHHNRVQGTEELREFLTWCQGMLRELHLSHNQLDTRAAGEIILAAAAVTNLTGDHCYPQRQCGALTCSAPLWLRLEQNYIDPRLMSQQVEPAFAELHRAGRLLCSINGWGCTPRCCMRYWDAPPAVHVKFLANQRWTDGDQAALGQPDASAGDVQWWEDDQESGDMPEESSPQTKMKWRAKESQTLQCDKPEVKINRQDRQLTRELMLSLRRCAVKDSAPCDSVRSVETASGGSESQSSQSTASTGPEVVDTKHVKGTCFPALEEDEETSAAATKKVSTTPSLSPASSESEEAAASCRPSGSSAAEPLCSKPDVIDSLKVTQNTVVSPPIKAVARKGRHNSIVAKEFTFNAEAVAFVPQPAAGNAKAPGLQPESSSQTSPMSPSRAAPESSAQTASESSSKPVLKSAFKTSLDSKAAAFVPTVKKLSPAQRLHTQVKAAVAANPLTSPAKSDTATSSSTSLRAKAPIVSQRYAPEFFSPPKASRRETVTESSPPRYVSETQQCTASAAAAQRVDLSFSAPAAQRIHSALRARQPRSAGRERGMLDDSDEDEFIGCMRGYSTEDDCSEDDQPGPASSSAGSGALLLWAGRLQVASYVGLQPGQLFRAMRSAGKIQLLLLFLFLTFLSRRASAALARIRGRR